MKTLSFLCVLLVSLSLVPQTQAKPAASRVLQTHGATVTALAYAPNGKTLASADEGGRVKLTDVTTGKTKLTFRYREKVSALAYAPDGKMLAVGRAKEIRLLNPQTAAPIRVLKLNDLVGESLEFSADSSRIISIEGRYFDAEHFHVKVWNPQTGALLRNWLVSDATATAATISPDGKTAAAALISSDAFGGGVRLWDIATGKETATWTDNSDKEETLVYAVQFSPDGKRIAGTGGYFESAGHLSVWNTATGALHFGRTFNDFGTALAWSPNSSRLAVGTSYDTTYDEPKKLHQPMGAPIFNAASGNWQQSLQRTPHAIMALSFAPDGQTIAIGAGKIVRLWRVSS